MDNQQQGNCITLNGIELKQISFAKDYFVSRCGKVFSRKRGQKKELKLSDSGGYKYVGISCDDGVARTMSVHRLVALNYIPNPDNKPQVNHINGIKADNRVENLEWATSQENVAHAIEVGLMKSKGEDNPKNILTEDQVLDIYNRCLGNEKRKSIAEEYGVDKSTLTEIINRRSWSYLTKDLPDVPINGKVKNLSEEEVRRICTMLQDGVSTPKIYDAVGRDILTKGRLRGIRSRLYYKDISKDYIW